MNKCRTDSPAYHDPDDVLSPAEEVAQEAKRERQVQSFFDNWDVKELYYYEALDVIMDSLDLELSALVSCAVKNDAISSPEIIREIKEEATKYAETQIDNNNVWWDWS